MKIKSTIPPALIASATVLLQEYIPELSPTSLIEALQQYGDNDRRSFKMVSFQGISCREAAEILGCSSGTIVNYLRNGQLKGGKIGPRKWKIDPKSVAAMLPK